MILKISLKYDKTGAKRKSFKGLKKFILCRKQRYATPNKLLYEILYSFSAKTNNE